MDPLIAPSVSTTTEALPRAGFDIFTTGLKVLSNDETTASLLSIGGFLRFLDTLWSIFVVLSFLFSIIMLAMYAYASTRRWQYFALGEQEIRDEEALYDEVYRGVRKTTRLQEVFAHIASDNPNDWKQAIIEADIVLDELLKQRGYVGGSLGERLRSIGPTQLASLDDAWEAHKVRNRIAHDGADFVLTKRAAEETINQYRRVFAEFGVQ